MLNELVYQAEDPLDGGGSQTSGGLVEQEKLSLRRQERGEPEELLLTERKLHGPSPCLMFQSYRPEVIPSDLDCGGTLLPPAPVEDGTESALAGWPPQRDQDVFEDTEACEHSNLLEETPNAARSDLG